MVLGILRLEIDVPESQSLKDKRSVIRSMRDRIGGKFKVAVAEVGRLDNLQHGELGIACVSNDRRQVDEILARIAAFAESNAGDGYVSNLTTEIINLG